MKTVLIKLNDKSGLKTPYESPAVHDIDPVTVNVVVEGGGASGGDPDDWDDPD